MTATTSTPFVIARESDFVVFAKPAGLSVHNDAGSLLDQARAEFPKLHLINRLDRDTSGLVLATPFAERVAALVGAVAAADARKVYRAIVKSPRDPATWRARENKSGDNFVFSDAMSDRAEGRANPLGAMRDRVPAFTRARLVGQTDFFWDLEVVLETGRQHQIRKHLAHHQIPIVGDPRYGREALNAKVRDLYGVERMMLHAGGLEFRWRDRPLRFQMEAGEDFARLMNSSTSSENDSAKSNA